MTDLEKLTKTFDEIGVHYLIKESKDNWCFVYVVSEVVKLSGVLRGTEHYFEFYLGKLTGY